MVDVRTDFGATYLLSNPSLPQENHLTLLLSFLD